MENKEGESKSGDIPTYPELRDAFSPECLQELSEKLAKSNGKAFFLVHPYYLVFQEDISGAEELYSPESYQARKVAQKRFYKELSVTLPKLIHANIPLIILQEIGDTVGFSSEDFATIHMEYRDLIINMKDLSEDIEPQDYSVIYTERNGPLMIRSIEERSLSNTEIVEKRLTLLKSVGLKMGLVAGMNFEPTEGNYFEFYASADSDNYSGQKNNVVMNGYPLGRYYESIRGDRKEKHTFQIIRPDQCVGGFVRMLAMNGIRPAITTLTYPDKIKTSSCYKEEMYYGERVYLAK
ncbi:MAG: hypothetical protein WCO33_01545 [bacterium]